jgi:hypothetical protein
MTCEEIVVREQINISIMTLLLRDKLGKIVQSLGCSVRSII